MTDKPNYEELEARLAEMEGIMEALRSGRVDAIVGERDVALVRLRETEEALRRLNDELEQRVSQRTAELEQSNRALETALAELRSAHVRMVEVERLTALGTIAAKVAHELNNPLMGVQNALAYARRHTTELPAIQALDDAQHELLRVKDIGEMMLHLARPQPRFSSVMIADLLERTLAVLGPDLHARGIDVVNEISRDFPRVRADASRLEQVFFNLVSNARDAMEGEEEKRLRFGARLERGMLIFEVEDTGRGISEYERKKLFDPFFTTKQAQGSGLGLPISKSIIDSLGGWIDFISREGDGTTFSVGLPLAEE